MKLRTLGILALTLALFALLTSCGSALSESEALDLLNTYWQRQAEQSPPVFGQIIAEVEILHMGECELSNNQKVESGADARWVVRYYLHWTEGGKPIMPDGERSAVIEKIDGQWILATWNRQSCDS